MKENTGKKQERAKERPISNEVRKSVRKSNLKIVGKSFGQSENRFQSSSNRVLFREIMN